VAIRAHLDELEPSWILPSGEDSKLSPSLQRSNVSSLHKLTASLRNLGNETLESKPNRIENFLNISSLNIRGKASINSEELSRLLDHKKIDILGLQKVLSSQVSVKGYKWFPGRKRASQSTRREGTTNQGIGFLVKNSIKTLVSVSSVDADYEIMWLKVAAKGQTNDTYIASIYGAGKNYPISNRQAFYNFLVEQCLKYSAKENTILLGDFNAHLGTITGDTINLSSNARLLKNLLEVAFNNGQDNMYPSLLKTTPSRFGQATRQEGALSSILNYMICSLSSLARVSSFQVEIKYQDDGANACGSDHHLLILKRKQETVHSSFEQPFCLMWDISSLQDELVRKKYQEALHGLLHKYKSLVEPLTLVPGFNHLPFVLRQLLQNTVATLLNHQVTLAMASVVPVIKVTPFSKPYWDESLCNLQTLRSSAHAKMRNYEHMLSSTSSEQVDFAMNSLWRTLHEEYVNLRHQLQHLAAIKKKQYWLGLMQDLEIDLFNDQRHFFAQIARLRGKKNNASIHSLREPGIGEDSSITSDPAELKAILFDSHSKLGINDPDDCKFDKLFCECIVNKLTEIDPLDVGPTFCETSITIDGVSHIVSNLQNNKAQGLDLMLNEPLKYGGAVLCKTSSIFSISFWSSEVTPSIWAKASVHLIHKGNGADALAAESYRPISLTSNIMKVFEHVILNRCTMHSDASNVLPEEQAGFRAGRSCTDQIYMLREVLESRRALKLPTCACFIDIKQAFPSTWHDAIWHRLREASISGKMFRIMQLLYMNNESAIITPYDPADSFQTDMGTRQGAVLSDSYFH
jgi:hypothetical protein